MSKLTFSNNSEDQIVVHTADGDKELKPGASFTVDKENIDSAEVNRVVKISDQVEVKMSGSPKRKSQKETSVDSSGNLDEIEKRIDDKLQSIEKDFNNREKGLKKREDEFEKSLKRREDDFAKSLGKREDDLKKREREAAKQQ